MSAFLPVLFLLITAHWIGFLLDEILFPAFHKICIDTPLFIIGVPRSGTSYTHRLIAKDTGRFTTMALWEVLLAPSVTERKLCLLAGRLEKVLGSPVLRIVNRITPRSAAGLDVIHTIRLGDPEEDYFLLIPLFACYLLTLPFPSNDELEDLAFFDDRTPPEIKKMIMAFYASCLKRHLYVRGEGKTFLSKNVAFSPMVKALTETFPDCRFICNVRNPLESVPSHISSMVSGAAIFDNDANGDEFRDRMVDLQRYSFSHLSEILPTLPDNRYAFLLMEDLKNDVCYEITKIYEKFGYSMPGSFRSRLTMERNKERNYSSGHTYSLSSFGLTAEEIETCFADVFSDFDFTGARGMTRREQSRKVR